MVTHGSTALTSYLVPRDRIELPFAVCKTAVLPLN